MSLAKHGKGKNNKTGKKTGQKEGQPKGKKNPVDFTVKKTKKTDTTIVTEEGTNTVTEEGTDNSPEVSTDTSTEEVTESNTNTNTSTEESTDTNTDISSLLRQQLAPAKKKGKKKQISAWVDEETYKAYTKYKGNGEKGQKSELINKLLKMAFDIKDEE